MEDDLDHVISSNKYTIPQERFNHSRIDELFNFLLVGHACVGKTSLLVRFRKITSQENIFKSQYVSTVGIDFGVRYIMLKNRHTKLCIWDTAGDDRFQTVTDSYYRGSHGVLVVYDVTKRNTFENLDDYMTKIRNNTYNNVPVVLIGNKSCSEVREVTTEEGEEYAAKHNIEFWETDAKDSKNVDRAFLRAAELVYMKTYESKYTEITEADKIIQTGKTVATEQCTIQ